MQARRRLLMQQSGLDTSPVILAYNAIYNANGYINQVDGAGYCVTDLYYYPTLTATGTIGYFGTDSKTCVVYKNNGTTKVDYWALQENQSPRKCINTGSDAIKFTLKMSDLDDCYAYLQDTGQIFFAGKNSIYYGHRNISELS